MSATRDNDDDHGLATSATGRPADSMLDNGVHRSAAVAVHPRLRVDAPDPPAFQLAGRLVVAAVDRAAPAPLRSRGGRSSSPGSKDTLPGQPVSSS
jgi:hypothetical protein